MGNKHLFSILNVILFLSQITNISTEDYNNQPMGRLLTPEEGCGISKVANTKIVGGTEAKPGAFPWIALVGRISAKAKMNFNCGGSLITSRHVLTAAHCVSTNAFHLVRLGEHDLTTMSDGEHKDYLVIRVDAHSNYNAVEANGDGQNDIAILTLERDVEFNDRIRPICLPLSNEFQDNLFINDNPFVAGWGNLKEFGKKSKVLMQVQVPVIDNALCDKSYQILFPNVSKNQFNDMVLCAGNSAGGQGTCNGDSGGPLMLPVLKNSKFPMYQIGIVAYSYGCGYPEAPGVYTRVSMFMDWIREKINQN